MRRREALSIRARLRLAILALVTTIVVALSALHLHGVIRETLEDVGERAQMVAEQVNAYLVESVNRSVASKHPPTPAESKKIWYEAVRTDELLRRFIERSLALSTCLVDIVIVDESNRILVAAGPGRAGDPDTDSRSWREWQRTGIFARTVDLFSSRRNFVLSVPVGSTGFEKPVLAVRAHLSPVLLRSAVEPQIHSLAAISAISLALSGVLAVLVSNLVAGSLERISQKIDRIASGENKDEEAFSSPELADLDSKLGRLQRQFSGARADVLHLRTNIDGMLRKLEEAVLVFSPQGRLQIAGEAAERLLAKSRQELLGETLDTVFPPWTGIGSALRKARESRSILREHPVTLERPNLPSVKLLVTVEPIDYEEGTQKGTLVSLRDADARRQIRAGFDTAQRLAAIGKITSGVAHEVKNPLNAMMLHLQLAQERATADPALSKDLQVIRSEMLRLDRVIKTFLDFNSPMDVHLTECDLAQIVRDVARYVAPEADQRRIVIESPDLVTPAPVVVDPQLVKQALLNVAINGLEAMETGGTLSLSLTKIPGFFLVWVRDTGPGIPPEIRDKIFNLYFTTKPAAAGTGLAQTFRIVQMHGGTIQVEGESGVGACLQVRLPEHESREAAA